MHQSILDKRAVVPFPTFTGERIYMEPIRDGKLPVHLARWAPTLDAMLAGMSTPSIVYLMIDQRALQAGEYHRRPGVHVDGYWDARVTAHRGGSPEISPGHKSAPDVEAPAPPSHTYQQPSGPAHNSRGASWESARFEHPEALVLASDVEACRAFVGTCSEGVTNGGDCSRVPLAGMSAIPLEAFRCYAGTVGTLHESLPVPFTCKRTIVRLNIPNAVVRT